MEQYISKSALAAEIENLENKYKKCPTRNSYEEGLKDGRLIGYKDALHKINTLGAKGPYEQCVQYDSIKAGIQAHAETYSFNIESEFFNQLTKEQQQLWRKDIEQAVISGGEAGANWKKEHLLKPADGDDLPEIDREVIVLTQPYPNDEHFRVAFAHRPNKYAKVWNYDLGEEQIVEIERYGKGEWNIPDIKYWLDVKLPKE